MEAIASTRDAASRYGLLITLALCAAVLGLTGYAVSDSLAFMVRQWETPEYSHAYFVPLLAAFLFWQRLPRLGVIKLQGYWSGFLLTCAALAICVIGELATIYTVVQYGYLALIVGLVVTVLGPRGAWLIGAALVYLVFAIPLPNFLYNTLSQSLQLISSEIGVAVIRLFGISVHLEGNVIDLGTYQLQVVEACSGLRYLFPLLSFGFLVACLFQAPLWQKALVLLSTVPITVLMNSFRIGVIGVLVEHYGIGMAEGFLHYFEGWIVFMACLGVLFLEIWLLHRLTGPGGSVWNRLDLSMPARSDIQLRQPENFRFAVPLVASVLLASGFGAGMYALGERQEHIPSRESLIGFPLLHKDWFGRESAIEETVLQTLRLTDYLMADYVHPEFELPVNFYVAYYESQRKGASVHSPKSCIPGGGWEIKELTQVDVDTGTAGSSGLQPLRVNRVIIQRGNDRQLVYYWFKQRDRVLTNEYLVKWYLFWDSLMQNRSDGALVRLVIPIPEGVDFDAAEAQLVRFIGEFQPLLQRFLPN